MFSHRQKVSTKKLTCIPGQSISILFLSESLSQDESSVGPLCSFLSLCFFFSRSVWMFTKIECSEILCTHPLTSANVTAGQSCHLFSPLLQGCLQCITLKQNHDGSPTNTSTCIEKEKDF
jgi:hypothetical protein